MGEGTSVIVPSSSSAVNEAAFQAMAQAAALVQATQFGMAAYAFRQAASSFESGENPRNDAPFWAEYCRAEADLFEGMDVARNGDRPKSVELTTRAVSRFTKSVLPLVDQIDELERNGVRAAVIVEINLTRLFKVVTEMMRDIVGQDFDSALDTASRISTELREISSKIATSEIPKPIAEEVGDALSAVARVIAGLESYARAEKASEERQWELAAKAFSAAKQSLREASEAYALSPKLASQAQMWQLLVETLVEPARNRCRRLQDVWANFDQFKEGMAKIARAAGATEITQTSIVESTAQSQLQSRIDIQVSLVNEFEDRTRHALNDLRAAIEAAPADEKARKAVLTELEKVIAGPAHETGFFDRFKRFSSNSAEVIANMAKVAAPVATAWNIFAPFFGLPVLPLPMK